MDSNCLALRPARTAVWRSWHRRDTGPASVQGTMVALNRLTSKRSKWESVSNGFWVGRRFFLPSGIVSCGVG